MTRAQPREAAPASSHDHQMMTANADIDCRMQAAATSLDN